MKLFHDKHYNNLEHSLKQAFQGRPVPELGLRWRQNVMSAVWRIGTLTTAFNPVVFVQRLAWRFVMAACLTAIILAGYMWYCNLSPFRDVNDVFLEEAVRVTALRQVYEEF